MLNFGCCGGSFKPKPPVEPMTCGTSPTPQGQDETEQEQRTNLGDSAVRQRIRIQ